MPKYIVKLNDYYFEYSTIVDAPVTFGMSLVEFLEYYKEEYGREGMRHLQARMKFVESKGTSSLINDSAINTLTCNRAGPNESELTIDELYKAYCLREPIRNGWKAS
jgi:hypothetical protein